MSAPKFHRSTTDIIVLGQPRVVNSYVLVACEDLAVTPSQEGHPGNYYVVTHVPTKLCLHPTTPKPFRWGLAKAKAVCLALTAIDVDWSKVTKDSADEVLYAKVRAALIAAGVEVKS